MLRTFFFFAYAVVACIIFAPIAFIGWLTYDKSETGPVGGVVQWVAKVALPPAEKLMGAELDLRGEENIPEGAALFVGNHQGFYDFFIACSHLGSLKSIVAKIEVSKIPIIAQYMKQMHCIFMDRKDIRQSLACINQAQARLEAGQSIVIFPEGTRSKGPVMNEFKPGALRAAIKAGTPIVPYAIDGSYKLYDQTRRVTKGKVKLSILPPVDPKALGMKHAELSQYVQSLIQAELDRMRAEDAEAKA
ncbi:MAG: 1-acyl-sn-glycerol-3-phosphate acyltransferase [Firmicutes bacterium]|nr:1-acyl-sn-glycerol-3-phosphate acyltransferase [Bacillota bacterium]MBQ4371351.1 1-acyl-sn-glycerol-3-phosphate acyltransferase [Bacillota bacterium]